MNPYAPRPINIGRPDLAPLYSPTPVMPRGLAVLLVALVLAVGAAAMIAVMLMRASRLAALILSHV